MANARTGHWIYKRNRRRVLRAATCCALCGQPLNPDLKWPDPWCTTADHIIPIADGGHNNGPLRAVHNQCNRKRWEYANKNRHGRQW